MRIVIDLQGTQTASRFRGIGRYTRSLVKSILSNKGEHHILLLMNGAYPDTIAPLRLEFGSLVEQENIFVWESLAPIAESRPENSWRRKSAELIREAFLLRLSPDFVILTTFFEGFYGEFVGSIGTLNLTVPTAIILYDLIPLINPEAYLTKPNQEDWYSNKLENCNRAQLLLTISESTKQEAIKYLNIPTENIVNISTSSENIFSQIEITKNVKTKVKDSFNIDREFLFYSGASDERKNHIRLISTYSQTSKDIRAKHQLVIAGHITKLDAKKFKNHALNCGLKRHELIILCRVSDESLLMLYNLCKAFVMPSWHEGFGLPALEAMKCGKAVIASNTSSLPEVIGRTDALFDPFDEQSILKKIEEVLTDDPFREDLAQHCLRQSEKFSWDNVAQRALRALESYSNNQLTLNKASEALSQYSHEKIITLLVDRLGRIPYKYYNSDLIHSADAISQNHPSHNHRQLFVDISELVTQDAKTGIQRVTKSILKEWLTKPPNNISIEPVYATSTNGYCYARKFLTDFLGNMDSDATDEFIAFQKGDIFLGLDLHHSVIPAQAKFYEKLRNHGVTVLFIVYDLLCISMPQHFPQGSSTNHQRWLNVVTENDGVICISKTVANEVNNWINKHKPERSNRFEVRWFHLGSDICESKEVNVSLEALPSELVSIKNRPTFLMVGTLEPRKGHTQVVDAFDQLWAEGLDINLVIVGKQGWMSDILAKRLRTHSENKHRLVWLEQAEDSALDYLYNNSTCLIAASEGEGFGLPLIEAAHHKLPIIARNIEVFREVAGESAYYYSSSNSLSLTKAVIDWLNLYKANLHPESGQMRLLSWQESACDLLEALGTINR